VHVPGYRQRFEHSEAKRAKGAWLSVSKNVAGILKKGRNDFNPARSGEHEGLAVVLPFASRSEKARGKIKPHGLVEPAVQLEFAAPLDAEDIVGSFETAAEDSPDLAVVGSDKIDSERCPTRFAIDPFAPDRQSAGGLVPETGPKSTWSSWEFRPRAT